jgi:hypothetical protein
MDRGKDWMRTTDVDHEAEARATQMVLVNEIPQTRKLGSHHNGMADIRPDRVVTELRQGGRQATRFRAFLVCFSLTTGVLPNILFGE